MAMAIPAIALVATAAGTAYSVYSQVEAAGAAEDMANYNRQVAEQNAQLNQQQAQYEADRISQRNRVLRGEQAAAITKSGVTISGSATDVMYSSEIQGELERLAALYSGDINAWRSRIQGEQAYREGMNTADTLYGRAIGTGISGVGQGLSQYSSMKRDQSLFSRGTSTASTGATKAYSGASFSY